jgi:hypothetical protein
MPSARLHFPDAAGKYSEGTESDDDDTIGTYIRQADGTLELDNSRRGWTSRGSYSVELGLLREIVSRTDSCPLCSFITTMFKKAWEREGSSIPAGDFWHGECSVLLQNAELGQINDPSKGLPYKHRWWSSWNVQFLSFSCWSKNEIFHGDAFLASPRGRIGNDPTLLGRYRPALCDVSLFRSWLRTCIANHPQCSRPSASGSLPLRLIDVNEMCLVTVSSDERARTQYLALSYVWGEGPKDFILTTTNLQDYMCPQGLPRLPATISDAITLTRRLEQRYLWVDSISIISNDEQDKAIQIPAMTSIYGCALLTIVAAAGQDANHGLPGLQGSRLEKNVVDIGCCHMVQRHTVLGLGHREPISGTKWASRAWTYQELVLSPRSLIFLEEQVIWRCEDAEWFEELDFDHPNLSFSWPGGFGLPMGKANALTVYNYRNLIIEYTERELTFESDIVNAFSGIMEAIPDVFFWGIPHSEFGEYLTWTVWRRPWGDDKDKFDQRRDCGLQVPSWSWFSWKGTISLDNDMKPYSSFLAVYRWQNGHLQQICTPRAISYSDYSNEDTIVWRDDADWEVNMDDIPKDVALNENQIIFWAFVIPVPIPGVGEWVLVAENSHFICTIRITWHDHIARREARDSFHIRDWPMHSAVKKLIIME